MTLLVSSTSYLFPSAVPYKSSFINGEYCVIRFFPLFARTLTYIMINIGKEKWNSTVYLHKTTALARTIIFTIIIFRTE